MILPAAYQPPLPLDRLLLPVGAPGAGDRMELDVLIVGRGRPASPARSSWRTSRNVSATS